MESGGGGGGVEGGRGLFSPRSTLFSSSPREGERERGRDRQEAEDVEG